MKFKGLTTSILHSDRLGSPEHGSLHKPIHTSVAYGYQDVNQLAGVFQGTQKGYAYGRQSNPTLTALEEKITMMEKGVGSVCFSTGMAGLGALFLTLLKKGDHLVSSSFLFGNTNSLLSTLQQMGVEVTFVDATQAAHVEKAICAQTKMVLVETIANPVTQIADLKNIGDLCEKNHLIYVVDNTMTTPYLFNPKNVKASLCVNSLTKYICGHGNALGGCVTDTGLFDWTQYSNILDVYKSQPPQKWGLIQIRKKGLRDFGGAMSPEDAHRISVGSETLALRLERACENANQLTTLLLAHKSVSKVYYPGLAEHPQHEQAGQLFKRFGALFSFELKDGLNCLDFLNELKVVIKSSNLGDNRTLAIPIAQTIFWEMGPERRESMGIKDSLIRVSTGIEDAVDLLDDFNQALSKVS